VDGPEDAASAQAFDAPAMHARKQHLRAVAAELNRLNGLLNAGGHELAPAWARITCGESRWPVVAAILVALVLQVSLPDQLALPSRWLLPGIEFVVLLTLIAMFPVRFDRESRALPAA
jgi:hypothetical protein